MAVLVASRASGVIMNRGIIMAYLTFLITGFDRIGLPMRAVVTQLQEARLNASYIADTKHLFGDLRNIFM